MNGTMTEQQLRAFDPKEIEAMDINWSNGTPNSPYKFTGKVLFDYDQGLSILKKYDSEYCLTAYHGPAYNGRSNYQTKKEYHEDLTLVLTMLKKGFYDGPVARSDHTGSLSAPTCSFT